MFNTVNYNNIFNAAITIFEALTLEGWSSQMFFLIDAGESTLAIIFYIFLIAFGSYFILNLILAVIMGSFTKFENQEIEDKIKRAEMEEMSIVKKNLIDSDLDGKNRRKSVLKRQNLARHSVDAFLQTQTTKNLKLEKHHDSE